MPRMCKAVKANGGFFEESKIYFDLTLLVTTNKEEPLNE
jgi:hypothetical protein